MGGGVALRRRAGQGHRPKSRVGQKRYPSQCQTLALEMVYHLLSVACARQQAAAGQSQGDRFPPVELPHHRGPCLRQLFRRLRDKVDRPFGRESIETVRGAGYRLRDDA